MTKLLNPQLTWKDKCCHSCGNKHLILKESEIPVQTVTKGTVKTKKHLHFCEKCNSFTLGVEPDIYVLSKFMTENQTMFQSFDYNKSTTQNILAMQENLTNILITLAMHGYSVTNDNLDEVNADT